MSQVSASACGKVILLGEHAVVYGVPALCAALPRGAEVHTVSGEGRLRVPAWQLATPTAFELLQQSDSGDSSALPAAYRAILRSLANTHALPPLHHDLVASFAIPTGAGLGSSAALAVAVVRCLDQLLELKLTSAQIAAAAFAAEQVFHGQPSGLDHTVAQHGGFGLFQRGPGLCALPDMPPFSLNLCIGHTGRARDTKGRVARVAELHAQNPTATQARFSAIGALVEQAAIALRMGDLQTLGAAMVKNQLELAALEVSCVEIDAMCALAHDAGALGAKLTGGGGGGCVVALAPGREEQVTAAWQSAGYQSFLVQIGTP